MNKERAVGNEELRTAAHICIMTHERSVAYQQLMKADMAGIKLFPYSNSKVQNSFTLQSFTH